MKLANPPKLFVASLIVFVLIFLQTQLNRTGMNSPHQATTFSRGHAAIVRPTQFSVTPTPRPTVTPFPAAIPLPAVRIKPVVTLPPALQGLINSVKDGQHDVVKGVYVDGVLALKVIQQPDNDWAFVSTDWGTATEFQNARANGVTGLLAHNFLSGQLFYDLKIGQEVEIVYGDGDVRSYTINNILKFQKLDLTSLTSDFIDLRTNKKVSVGTVFNEVYSGGDHVTLQTCLEKDGVSNWGLEFIIATPLSRVN